MSRVGKHIVNVPNGVNITFVNNTISIVKGNKEAKYTVPTCLDVKVSSDGILFTPINKERETRALWGTTQRNVSNIIKGLVEDFKITLKLTGVGYKAAVKGKKLDLQLGFSHDVAYDIPNGVSIVCPDPTTIIISGADKKQIGDVAAFLRSYRKPEPYKGKGISRVGEFIYRKEGKKK